MLFNSTCFIYAFLPTVVIIYFILNHFGLNIFSKLFLISSSLYFYAYFKITYLPLIIGSVLFNYAVSVSLHRIAAAPLWQRRVLLGVGLAGNLGVLGYYKYYDFFISNINALFGIQIPLLHLLLPLGISFFTFQQISYLVDSYYRREINYNPIDYGLFVTFFPQLVAGPIVLPSEMLPQFEDSKRWRFNYENASRGLFLFMLGLMKKCAVADTLALLANGGFNAQTPLNFSEAWLSSLAFTLQLYFDFSGYCDMAMGIALLFNIELPLNFNSPYKSGDFQSFWRRWHMTLGRFMMNYLYIPLGGNRHGERRTFINLITIFVVSGIWHGAGWTYILWGGFHGIGILIHRIWKRFGYGRLCGSNGLPSWIAIPVTFFFVNLFWIFFRADNIEKAGAMICTMFYPSQIAWVTNNYRSAVADQVFNFDRIVPVLLVSGVIVFFLPNSYEFSKKIKKEWFFVLVTVFSFLLGILFVNRLSPFLYFNF